MANVADANGIADGDGSAGGKAKTGHGRRRLIVIAGGAVLALAAAGGGYMYFAGADKAADAPAAAEQKPVSFVDLPQMTVNLNAPADRPSYLKMTVALEVSDERLVEQVQPMIPRIMDAFQSHMRELRPQDFEGSAGLYRLREELLRRINQAVFPAKVDAILFKELLIQ